jgi:hypothetical protein
MGSDLTDSTESLEAHVARLRRDVLARHGFQPGDTLPTTVLSTPIDEAQRLATVSAHWGIASTLPVFGTVQVFVRRVTRLLLRWYINPIVEQQNAFNQATVRALYDLQADNEALRSEIARLSRPCREQPAG